MSNEPKKRGRPKKQKVENTTIDISQLAKLPKDQLLTIFTTLGLIPEKDSDESPKSEGKTKKAKFVKNKFVDNGTKVKIGDDSIDPCKEDREFTKQVVSQTSKRSRKTIVHKNKCNTCNKTFEGVTSSEFLCPSCMGIKK